MPRNLIDNTARIPADPDLVEAIFHDLYVFGVDSALPCAATALVGAPVPGVEANRAGGTSPKQDDDARAWRWATDFPSPHKMKVIGDD